MQNELSSNRSRSGLLIIFSLLGIFGFMVRAIWLVFISMPMVGQSDHLIEMDLSSNMLSALGMIFCAFLLIPIAYYSIRRYQGKNIQLINIPAIKLWQAAVLLAIWLLVLIASYLIENNFTFGWYAYAPFYLLGITLPIVGFVWLGLGGLPIGSRRRLWSVFGFSLVGSTALAMVVEYLLIGITVAGGAILLFANPDWLVVFEKLQTQVTSAADIESILTLLAPYLTNPIVFLLILVLISGLGPMLEESIKPLAIWLLGRRMHSPAMGFALGVLCGAGFALLEGLLATSATHSSITFNLPARATSSLMHITLSGLMGWAIASVRLERRYLRLILVYLFCVGAHGLWNASISLAIYGSLRMVVTNTQMDAIGALAILIGIATLSLLFVFMLFALPLVNQRMRLALLSVKHAPMPGDLIAPPKN